MPKSHDRPLHCPICGYVAAFTLNVATIHGVNVIQTEPLQFRRDSRSLKQFDFIVPQFCSCQQCGQAIQPPPSLIDAALKFRTRRR